MCLRRSSEIDLPHSRPTALRIPPELIAQIALSVVLVCAKDKDHLAPGDRSNRGWIGSCILVCRYWAIRLRPVLFKFIALYGDSDFHGLAGMLSNPGAASPTLAECIHDIDVWQSGPWTTPWIHHISRIQTYVSHPLEFGLWMRRIEDPRLARRCLQGPLPRTLPGCILGIGRLFLESVHFHSVSELINLVGYLPNLTSVRCAGILSFADEQIPQRRVLQRRVQAGRTDKEFVAEVEDCGGPLKEQRLMFKLLFEICHENRYDNGDTTWRIFHDIVVSFTVPCLIASVCRVKSEVITGNYVLTLRAYEPANDAYNP